MLHISVVIPLYNKAGTINETLLSVLRQSYLYFEIILVNDGSTDNSLSIVETFTDDRIKIFTKKNQGVSSARNFGIKKSNYELIAFLDADDIWLPNHLEEISKLYNSFSNSGIYAMNYEKSFFNSSTTNTIFNGILNSHYGLIENYFRASTIDCICWTSSLAIPKNILLEFNGFDETLKTMEDIDLWTRIALKYKVAFSCKITAIKKINDLSNHLSYKQEHESIIAFTSRFETIENENKSLNKYMDLNRFSSAIERKIASDYGTFKVLKSKINLNNLNYKQRLILALPRWILNRLKHFKFFLIKRSIYISPFR